MVLLYWGTKMRIAYIECFSGSSYAPEISARVVRVIEAMKRLEAKIACAADVQQVAVN